jgi:hypothetical protein
MHHVLLHMPCLPLQLFYQRMPLRVSGLQQRLSRHPG